MSVWDQIADDVRSGQERDKLEFKHTLKLETREGRMKFARDVSAIANTEGQAGYIVVGVLDARHRECPSSSDAKMGIVGFACQDSDEFSRQAVDALRHFVYPPPRIEFHFCQLPEGPVLVIEIPQSYARPHAISRDGPVADANEIYVRAGTSCRTANVNELERMIRQQKHIIILNFSHPLAETVLGDISRSLDSRVQEVHELRDRIQFDLDLTFADQARLVLDNLGFTPATWQMTQFAVGPPEFAPANAVIMAELHGRTGHFPTIFRRRRVAGALEYVWAETICLQDVRDRARGRGGAPI